MNYKDTVLKYVELINDYQFGNEHLIDIIRFNEIVCQILKDKGISIKKYCKNCTYYRNFDDGDGRSDIMCDKRYSIGEWNDFANLAPTCKDYIED